MHRLTPLEKFEFLDFERLNLLWPNNVSFLSRTLLNIIPCLIFYEHKKGEKNIFYQKHWAKPFGKMRFFGPYKIECFWPKMVSFLSRTLLKFISSLIFTEIK